MSYINPDVHRQGTARESPQGLPSLFGATPFICPVPLPRLRDAPVDVAAVRAIRIPSRGGGRAPRPSGRSLPGRLGPRHLHHRRYSGTVGPSERTPDGRDPALGQGLHSPFRDLDVGRGPAEGEAPPAASPARRSIRARPPRWSLRARSPRCRAGMQRGGTRRWGRPKQSTCRPSPGSWPRSATRRASWTPGPAGTG